MAKRCISKPYSMPTDLVQDIKTYAEKSGMKESTIVQKAVTEYLERNNK